MIVPGLYRIAYDYNVSIDTVSWIMVGSTSFSIGVIIFFVAAAATIWGKETFVFHRDIGFLDKSYMGIFLESRRHCFSRTYSMLVIL
jgi:hypothetical protein